jgi:hypothetical protein
MAKTVLGATTSPVSFPGYPQQENDEAGYWKHTERYWIATGSVSGSLPARHATTNQTGATVTDPDSNTLYCVTRTISAGPAPGISIVELVYTRYPTSYSRKKAEDNPRTDSLRSQEIPIDDERLLTANGGPFSAAQIADAVKAGYKSLPVYSVEYTYTDGDANFTWSQANIIASLQATGTPTGMSSATASKWRLTGREISEREDLTVITSHWEYMPSGFVPILA